MDNDLDDREALRQLLAEWASPPAEMIDVIPKGGVELKYLGHAATTRAGPLACGFTCTCAASVARVTGHASRASLTR